MRCVFFVLFSIFAFIGMLFGAESGKKPNIVLIYTDDLGYGDVSCNGGKEIPTPNIDSLAKGGISFTNAHSTSAMCTPSRYALLTGQYPWRRAGTGIAPGNAGSIIPVTQKTLPSMLKEAGYNTAVVGKWHLGLGPKEGPDWNGEIKPGPLELGFDYSFIIPATVDRVPCVYVENHKVYKHDPNDPIKVSYRNKVGDWPTGRENPELLIVKHSHGHDMTIVNGIGRIGYMHGGKSALWSDEDIADTITGKAIDFIKENKDKPFFLYFATHDIHVPRWPHERYRGKSGHGLRGDAILQLDGSVADIMKTLEELGLKDDTLVIFSSDNGPVVDDGYYDRSIAELGDHKPAGPFRGAKYSVYEAGTRIPFIVHYPERVKPQVSDLLFSQIDLFASLCKLADIEVPADTAPDSQEQLAALLGKTDKGRDSLIEQALSGALCYVTPEWKFIEPHKGNALMGGPLIAPGKPIETGNSPDPQLYDMKKDLAETENVAEKHPELVEKFTEILKQERSR